MIGIFGFPPNNKKFMDRGKSILRIMSSTAVSAVGWTAVQSCRAAEQSGSSEQEIVFDVPIKRY